MDGEVRGTEVRIFSEGYEGLSKCVMEVEENQDYDQKNYKL
jgi:hypothetical protein